MPKISKMGNSVGIYIPKEALDAIGLVVGDEVECRPRGGILELIPIERRQRLRPKVMDAYQATKEQFGPAFERLAE